MARLKFESEHRTVNQRGLGTPNDLFRDHRDTDDTKTRTTTASDGKATDAPDMANPITFDVSSFGERVFLDNQTEQIIQWTLAEGTEVREVQWRIEHRDPALGAVQIRPAWGTEPSPNLNRLAYTDVDSTSARIRPTQIRPEDDAYEREMFLRIGWQRPGTTSGWWDSGPFGVVTDAAAQTKWRDTLNPTPVQGTAYDPSETIVPESSSASEREPSATTETSPSLQTTSGTVPASTSGASTLPTGGPDQNEDSGSDGGLSTGAIAGIAVGAGALLIAIVSLLVWLFVMRPRRKRRMQENASASSLDDAHGGVPALMLDKETSRLDDGPHEPYVDNHAAPAMAEQQPSREHDEERSYTPYQQPNQANSAQNLTRSGAATPQGLPTSVAHLVEDGMTEDEIRRLEEEERQLDDAIERARRR